MRNASILLLLLAGCGGSSSKPSDDRSPTAGTKTDQSAEIDNELNELRLRAERRGQRAAESLARRNRRAADYEPYVVVGPRETQEERRIYMEKLAEESGINAQRKAEAAVAADEQYLLDLEAIQKEEAEDHDRLLVLRKQSASASKP